MTTVVNSVELTDVFFNGTVVDQVYFNNTLIYQKVVAGWVFVPGYEGQFYIGVGSTVEGLTVNNSGYVVNNRGVPVRVIVKGYTYVIPPSPTQYPSPSIMQTITLAPGESWYYLQGTPGVPVSVTFEAYMEWV